MQIRTIAEIATIIGVLIGGLTYLKIEPNALDKISIPDKKDIIHDIQKINLSFDKNEFQTSKNPILEQYKAAILINSNHERDNALTTVIKKATISFDFKIAILAAKEISTKLDKSEALKYITYSSLKSNDQKGYATLAANLIPYKHDKDEALKQIISHYSGNKIKRTRTNGAYRTVPFTKMEKYKYVFNFADSQANMNMSTEDAKIFTDDWFQENSFETFLYFKKIFNFADSQANMDMNAENAKHFALKWIKEYTEKDFYVFQNAFTFADSSSGMAMNEKEAEEFAFKKVIEYK